MRVLERKTTSEDISTGATYWKRLTLDVQVSTYLVAAASLGYPVTSTLFDVLRKPGQKPSVAKQETPERYGERVLEAICEDPERYYARREIVRLEKDAFEAATDLWQTASAIRDARRLRVFPRNADACMQWSRECQYLNICAGIADANDPVMYVVEPKKHGELDMADFVGDLELLTQSSARAYRSCPRKYELRYERRLRSTQLKAGPLRKGSSVHKGLEVFSLTGDLEAGIGALETEEPFSRAHERAMLIGYAARWDHEPLKYVAIEKEFLFPLRNPETGAASKTFIVGGRLDGIVE